jgi:hypothetical protein
MPAAKYTLVQNAEEGVQNCGLALKDFVEKSDVGLRQHTHGVCFNHAVLEFVQIDRRSRWVP